MVSARADPPKRKILWVATPLVKRQPLPEGIEWHGKRSDAAAMPRYDSYMSNENNLLFEISEAIRLAAEGSVSCWFCGSR